MKRITKRFKWVILTVIALIVIGSGIHFIAQSKFESKSQNTLDTLITNWKTYTNSDIGVSFRYPADLIPEEKQKNNLIEINFTNALGTSLFVTSGISYDVSGKPITVESLSTSTQIILGRKFVKIPALPGTSAAYIEEEGNKLLTLQAEDNVLNEILSTLTFTK